MSFGDSEMPVQGDVRRPAPARGRQRGARPSALPVPVRPRPLPHPVGRRRHAPHAPPRQKRLEAIPPGV